MVKPPAIGVALEKPVLDDPVHLAVEGHRVLLQTGQQMLPTVDRGLHLGWEPRAPRKAHRPIEVLPLDVEGRQLAAVGESDLAPTGHVVGDLPDGADRILQGEVAEHHVPFDHLEQGDHGPDFDVGGVLGHVGVAGDHMETSIALGVGVRLVPGVDDRP